MRWVNRGPEPTGLARIRSRYTPGWVQRYRNGIGDRPTDARWRDFHDVLYERFSGLCAYCERHCPGETDHFRPKRVFPELTYQWSNWLLACTPCNRAKGDSWPQLGYVNPCAESPPDRPENYFDYDIDAGLIVPRADLNSPMRERANRMIADLKLNHYHQVKARLGWIRIVRKLIINVPDSEIAGLVDWLTSGETEHPSIARALLAEVDYMDGD